MTSGLVMGPSPADAYWAKNNPGAYHAVQVQPQGQSQATFLLWPEEVKVMYKAVRIPTAKAMPSKAAWSVAISSVLIGLFWLFPRVQLLIAPVSDGSLLGSWAIPISYFSAALFGAYLIALLGALYCLRMASVVLVCLLFVMAFMAVTDNVVLIRYTVELSGANSLLRSSRNVWELSGSVRWVFWFLFNYWFFIKRDANF